MFAFTTSNMVLDLVILALVLLLVIADWPKIQESLVRLRFGRSSSSPGLKRGMLWLCAVPARILPYESPAVIGAAAFLILALSYPAFSGFFIGEDFTYLALFQSAGNHFWAGIMTPFQHHLFFRPSAAAWYLLFNHVLPVDPWAHHLRNYATTIAAAALLYALSRRLVANPLARAAGVAFFAVSKVHLTTIGYINCNDSIMSLIQIEAVLLLLILYFQTGRTSFLYLSYIPYTLEVFARDYGSAVFAVVATAILVQSRHCESPRKFVATRLAPFAGIGGIYFLIRGILMSGETIGSSAAYHLALSPVPMLYRAWLFAGNLFNISLATIEVTGSGSFATLLHAIGIAGRTRPWDIAYVVLASAFVISLIVRALSRDLRLLIPIVWAAAFIVPTFLIANIQMYYVLEPLAGVALAIAMASENIPGKYWARTGAVILGIAAVNTGVESRSVGVYSWRFCADAAQRAYDEAVRPHIGQNLRSWTLLVPNEGQLNFWRYTLAGDGTYPMIPTLLGLPNLKVQIAPARSLTSAELAATDAPDYLLSNERLLRVAVPEIASIVPSSATVGTGFNVQPDGSSAVWVNSRNALPSTVILWNGSPLATTVGSEKALSALIPAGNITKPGSATIKLRDRITGLESREYQFEIRGAGRSEN